MANKKPPAPEFQPGRTYIIGRLKAGSPMDISRPEFAVSQEISGDRICRKGCTMLIDFMDKNPFRLDPRFTWHVYEREGSGAIRHIGADKPQSYREAPDVVGSMGDDLPLFDDHRTQQTPAYRQQIELLERQVEYLQSAHHESNQNVGKLIEQNEKMMERMNETSTRMSQLDAARVTAETKLATEIALMQAREAIRIEERERAEEEAAANAQSGGLADFIPGLDWATLLGNLPVIIQSVKSLISNDETPTTPPAIAQGGGQSRMPQLTPEEIAQLQQVEVLIDLR